MSDIEYLRKLIAAHQAIKEFTNEKEDKESIAQSFVSMRYFLNVVANSVDSDNQVLRKEK